MMTALVDDVALGKRTLWIVMWLIMMMGMTIQAQNCTQQERCGACIQTPGCMWCSNPKNTNDTEGKLANCQQTTIDASSFCEPEDLENPKNTQQIIVDAPLTILSEEKSSLPEGEKIIQLSPQRMKLKLRKGTPENLTITYRQAQDYPVDLYYLMDLSKSMGNDKDQLASLGGKLTRTLSNLTSKYTIGFGSFVDKVMMPYVDLSPKRIDSPCDGCVRAYAFKNILPLSSDGTRFTEEVRKANISGNLDAPEGGFDALMQAMVCKEAIGWRKQSRRILVFSTDDDFHCAGDGKLAGIATPNDETCHLNSESEYDAYDKYDYPSIAQINKVAKEQNINIIFAVSNYLDLYKEVSSMIDTSSYGFMEEDSSNVIELVVNQYNAITSVVQLTDNSTNSPVSIQYRSSCLNNTPPIHTKKCAGINQGVEVTFDLEVTLNECPKDQDKVIVEVKTLQDSLFLEIEFDCDCNCKTEGRTENSSICSHQGALVCGVCECSPGFRGSNCKCSTQDSPDGRPEDENLCKADGDDQVCSGQGSCSCGACMCWEPATTGDYCECNSRKCIGEIREECSGNGTCDCDKCVCDKGYSGQFCECPTDEVCKVEGKRADKDAPVCSGHGTCDCGHCTCDEGYNGKYCDDCLTCNTGKCLEFHDCVQCQFKTPPCVDCDLKINSVPSLQPYIDDGARSCPFEDDDGCTFTFTYLYRGHDTGYDIHIKETKDCPEEASLIGIVLGLVAGIVAIALLTLLFWKLVTSLHDRKEYAKFEDERKKATWNTEDNPLYKNPSSTIQNPVFAQS